jgi:hypothetical protein
MAQHDYVIDNQTAPNFRADLNNALSAIVSNNSGSLAPSPTYANMLWYDDGANILRMRNEANDGWINIGYLDQSANAFRILDNTQVTTTAGSQTGLLGNQTTSTWESGTGTTESLVSPAKVKAAIEALALSVGVGQSWQAVSRVNGTTYQNTTGRPIMVQIEGVGGGTVFETSVNGSTWVQHYTWAGGTGVNEQAPLSAVIPANHYYRTVGGSGFNRWTELR